jgi:predicted enzyme related to lactoylglutathione lyase
MKKDKGKVTGIGGVFFKSRDPKALKAWYAKSLGIPVDKYGHSFVWREDQNPEKRCLTQWSPMEESTDYYAPSEHDFMINYRVEHLDTLLKHLKSEGAEQVGEVQDFDYGRFAWVLDPEGRKIELWEPKDEPLL